MTTSSSNLCISGQAPSSGDSSTLTSFFYTRRPSSGIRSCFRACMFLPRRFAGQTSPDACHKVRGILQRHRREADYVEVSLDSEYRYNPLHNDLEAYALAYNIASLLNNLFGKGKEPFWQQAYTNLVKFIILLHKVAFDYVTLFDVYHCAISPELLQQRIEQAEDLLFDKHFVFIPKATYEEHIQVLIDFDFLPDEAKDTDQYRAPATPALEGHLKKHAIEFRKKPVPAPEKTDPDKRAQLEAVKRWFYDDWQRIEPKLRTSIVEGISVFLCFSTTTRK